MKSRFKKMPPQFLGGQILLRYRDCNISPLLDIGFSNASRPAVQLSHPGKKSCGIIDGGNLWFFTISKNFTIQYRWFFFLVWMSYSLCQYFKSPVPILEHFLCTFNQLCSIALRDRKSVV